MADEIVGRLAPRTALDAGCAVGFLVKALWDRGVDAWGVDFSEYAISQVPASISDRCWRASIVDELPQNYDLISCIEVLEHLPAREASLAVGNLCRHAGAILFSSTPEHFDEVTHLNVRPPYYWAGLFAQHGFYRVVDFDASFVSPHAVLFRPAGSPSEAVAAYERWHWEASRELDGIRAHRDFLHQQVDRAFAARDAAVAEREALLRTKTFRMTAQLREAWARAKTTKRGHPDTSPPLAYPDWVRRYDTLGSAGRRELEATLAELRRRRRFSIVMPVFDPEEAHLRSALDSVLAQVYPGWQLCIADDSSTRPAVREILEEYRLRDARIRVTYRRRNGGICRASNSALALADGEYVVLLDDNDELAPHALACFAIEVDRHPDAVLVYSDEDKLDHTGSRCEPYFKPDWNPPLLLGQNYLSHLTAFRREEVMAAGGFRSGMEGSQDHDLTLRVVERASASQIHHLPLVLYHWRMHPGSTSASLGAKPSATGASLRAVSDHLRRSGVAAEVVPAPFGSGNRVRRRLPRPLPPVRVTVVGGFPEAASETLAAVKPLTRYPAIRLATSTELLFDRAFGSNRAATGSGGGDPGQQIFCSIVAGVEVMDEDWLQQLVSEFADPEVGMVGGRLETRDGRLIRGPLAFGPDGEVASPLDGVARDRTGYFGHAWLVHDVAALAPGCLAIRASVLSQVGGALAAPGFEQVAELCLRVRETGYRVRWTPYSRLGVVDPGMLPMSGPSEGSVHAGRLNERLRTKYHQLLADDPAYSSCLSLEPGRSFDLAWPPRRSWEWRFLGQNHDR